MKCDGINLVMNAKMSNIYFGTSGLILPVAKHLYPPQFQEGSRLTYYSSLYNSLEINSSFYKIPMASTVSKWAASVHESFRFTFKLWKVITHNKELDFNESNVERFILTINSIGNKKGCLLVQFPPKLNSQNIQQLIKLIETIKRFDPSGQWKVALEFRNRSWYHQDIYEIAEQYNAGIVMQDKPASLTPMIEIRTDFVYLRFHGPGGNYRGSYPDDFLYEYAGYIKEWHREQKTIYVYFNNTMGEALNNLRTLKNFIVDE